MDWASTSHVWCVSQISNTNIFSHAACPSRHSHSLVGLKRWNGKPVKCFPMDGNITVCSNSNVQCCNMSYFDEMWQPYRLWEMGVSNSIALAGILVNLRLYWKTCHLVILIIILSLCPSCWYVTQSLFHWNTENWQACDCFPFLLYVFPKDSSMTFAGRV